MEFAKHFCGMKSKLCTLFWVYLNKDCIQWQMCSWNTYQQYFVLFQTTKFIKPQNPNTYPQGTLYESQSDFFFFLHVPSKQPTIYFTWLRSVQHSPTCSNSFWSGIGISYSLKMSARLLELLSIMCFKDKDIAVQFPHHEQSFVLDLTPPVSCNFGGTQS